MLTGDRVVVTPDLTKWCKLLDRHRHRNRQRQIESGMGGAQTTLERAGSGMITLLRTCVFQQAQLLVSLDLGRAQVKLAGRRTQQPGKVFILGGKCLHIRPQHGQEP